MVDETATNIPHRYDLRKGASIEDIINITSQKQQKHEKLNGKVVNLCSHMDAVIVPQGTMAEWLSREIKPKEYLLGHIYYKGARVLIDGDTGLGKSRFALAKAYAAASGKPFLRWPAGQQCRVLFLDFEMRQEEVRHRLEDMVAGGSGPIDGLFIHSFDESEDLFRPLDTEEGHNFVIRLVEHHKADFVIIDNLMAAVQGQITEETWKLVEPLVMRLSTAGITVRKEAGVHLRRGQSG